MAERRLKRPRDPALPASHYGRARRSAAGAGRASSARSLPWRLAPRSNGAYDRDDVYREVCQRHPDAAVIVPPRHPLCERLCRKWTMYDSGEPTFPSLPSVTLQTRLVPDKGRLLLVTPSRRRGEMLLHRSIRRHASATTDICRRHRSDYVLLRSGHGPRGLAEIENSNRIVSSAPGRPRTDRPIGETRP